MTKTEFKKAMAGMTIPEAAESLGVSESCVDKWRSGKNQIPEPVAKLIARMRKFAKAKK